MRKMYALLLLLFIAHTSIFALSNKDFLKHYATLSYQGDVDYVLSYPGSGNTLVRYIFEFITHRPSIELRLEHSLLNLWLAYSFKELQVDVYGRPLWKVHRNRFITAQNFYDLSRTRLVFLIRNYKETALRYSQTKRALFTNGLPLFDEQGALIEDNLKKVFSIWDNDDTRDLYFKNIEFFDQCDENKRLLIYYEDLIEHPCDVVDSLALFFESDPKKVHEIKQNYEYYKNRIHSFYDTHERVSSNVEDTRYYSKQISYEQCVMIDEWVKTNHPDLWPYVSRYEEKNFRSC